LNNAGCTPDNLKLVVLTHGDNDHVANASFIKEKYNAEIAIHSEDLELVENPSLEKVMENFHFKALIYKVIFPLLKKKIYRITEKTLDDYERIKPDILLSAGDSLLKYGFDAKIIHLPGHTHGSIGILTGNGDLVAGDILTNNKKPDASPNAIDFAALKKSILRLQSMDIKTVYPGHGKPFEMKQYKFN
jgi:hydroxyacylglutathione hydrolase